jgi:hypothetical protein
MCSEEVHRNVLTIYVVLNKTPYTLRHPVGVEIGIVLVKKCSACKHHGIIAICSRV